MKIKQKLEKKLKKNLAKIEQKSNKNPLAHWYDQFLRFPSPRFC